MSSARELFRGKTDHQLETLWAKYNDVDPASLIKSRIEVGIGGDSTKFKVEFTTAQLFHALRIEIESRPGLALKLGIRISRNVAYITDL